MRALGEKPYPVLVCVSCSRLTGWVGERGACDACLRREQLRSAYADPHGGWVDVSDARTAGRPGSPARPLGLRLAAFAGRGVSREHAADREWLALVDPDETGPISPEAGYELEAAARDQVAAADGSGTIVIRFSTAAHRFSGKDWEKLDGTRIPHTSILVPTEFSAGLPVEQLVEAWGDYGAAVRAFNCVVWRRQAEAQEEERQVLQERAVAAEEQAHVIDLLREDG